MTIRPGFPAGLPRLGFEPRQRQVDRVPPEPPRVPGPGELLVEVPAVREDDMGEEPAVTISPATRTVTVFPGAIALRYCLARGPSRGRRYRAAARLRRGYHGGP